MEWRSLGIAYTCWKGERKKYIYKPCEKTSLKRGYLGEQEEDVRIVFTRIVDKLLWEWEMDKSGAGNFEIAVRCVDGMI
jgi:hypothetical protein